jgi:hypothetical protein
MDKTKIIIFMIKTILVGSICFALIMIGLSLTGCSSLPVQSVKPPPVAYVAVSPKNNEPPEVKLPQWETGKLTKKDLDNYSAIGKAYVVEGCQKDKVIRDLMTYLDAYRKTPNIKTQAEKEMDSLIAKECGDVTH